MTHIVILGFYGSELIRKRCGFIYSDYIRGIQRLFDGLPNSSLIQVVRPNTCVEYEIFWFGLELADVLCYQRSPIVRPLWFNVNSGYVVLRMYFCMWPVTRCSELSEPVE
jgi:hypothetical protein